MVRSELFLEETASPGNAMKPTEIPKESEASF
jgi:hypothetical protein